MKPNRIYTSIAMICMLLFTACDAQTKIVLPSIFTDNMVLQQKSNVVFWGTSAPGKAVNIRPTWNGKSYTAKADARGNWKILVQTPAYGGPYAVSISDGKAILLSNVMIGEVWICSGQSNMEMPLAGWGKINNYAEEIANANYKNIRLFQVEHITSDIPLTNAQIANGGWKPCTPEYVAEFSSVAYFFAREIYKKTGIPIGLIHTSWGGTVAEAWTSATTIRTMPDFAEALKKVQSAKSGAGYEKDLAAWQKMVVDKDAGNGKDKPGWAAPLFNDSSWENMLLPNVWEQGGLPGLDGVVYFRKKIVLPSSWEGKSITLNLGTIDDNDITYFNGQKIGETEGYNKMRIYKIAADKVKAGDNVIVVRVFDGSGGGGLYGDKNILSVVSASGEKISLDGEWRYNVGLNLKDIAPVPESNTGPNRPTVLYNAMINPFIQYTIRGAIWYQGEANADRAHQYRTLFPAMIADWRNKWKQGNFPFYYVQLANFMNREDEPVPSAWAELRDAQLQTLSVPNTGMGVAIDIGIGGDIHPKNKQEVGRRLALVALAKTYGKPIAYSGPLFSSQQIEGKSIRLNFRFAEGGLNAKGGSLAGFAIAGVDQKFHWAKAVIQGNQIIVSSEEVPNPVAVRYAWANNPDCNLYNGAGLPASPFRTDTWKDSTDWNK